jgi:hypothetical protein
MHAEEEFFASREAATKSKANEVARKNADDAGPSVVVVVSESSNLDFDF